MYYLSHLSVVVIICCDGLDRVIALHPDHLDRKGLFRAKLFGAAQNDAIREKVVGLPCLDPLP